MENEGELNKSELVHTDGGFSEKKLAKQVDLGVSSNAVQSGQIFIIPKKTPQTVFQAQRKKKI